MAITSDTSELATYTFPIVCCILLLPLMIMYIFWKNRALPNPVNYKYWGSYIAFSGICFLSFKAVFRWLAIHKSQENMLLIFIIFFFLFIDFISEMIRSKFKKADSLADLAAGKMNISSQISNSAYEFSLAETIRHMLEKSIAFSEICIFLQSEQSVLGYNVIFQNADFDVSCLIPQIRKGIKNITFVSVPDINRDEKKYCFIPFLDRHHLLGGIVMDMENASDSRDQENVIIQTLKPLQKIFTDLVSSIRMIHLYNRQVVQFQRDNKSISVNTRNESKPSSFLNEISRKNYALILHDNILQDIITIRNRQRRLLREDSLTLSLDSKEKMQLTIDECESLISAVRTLSMELNPAFLYYSEMYDSLVYLIDNYNLKVSNEDDLSFSLISPKKLPIENIESKQFIYRIAKELNENSLQHAKASWVTNEFVIEKDTLIYTIEDDGVGFDLTAWMNDTSKKSIGILSIESDVQAKNGSMEIQTKPQIDGTMITIKIPMEVLK